MILMATGGINEAKKRLLTLIRLSEPALGVTEATSHVFGDWRLGIQKIYTPRTGPKMPVVTVRISPARVIPSFYGRIWEASESGDIGLYSFTAHCFTSACTASGEEKYKHAHDLADKIMQYLSTRDWNSSPNDSYPIGDVFNMQARESEPSKGAQAICRVIIEGIMLVKRTD